MTTEMRDTMMSNILGRLIKSETKAEDNYLRRELMGATKRAHSAAMGAETTDGGAHAPLMVKCNLRSRAMGFIR